MEKRRLGSLEVSVIGLGCNNFGGRLDVDRTGEVLHAAIDAGINFFDTADVYGGGDSEQFMGANLKGRRDEVLLATKFGHKVNDEYAGGTRPEYVKRAAEGSLRRLGVDTIDLYQIHHPDPSTPIADTLGAMAELVQEGKVREIGCSNFTVEQLREAKAALADGMPGFVSVQNELSLLRRGAEKDVVPECEREHLAFLPFFPLASGLLTGKYRRDAELPEGSRITGQPPERRGRTLSDENFSILEALSAFAERRGHTLLELAFARLLAYDVIPSVIAGATSPAQVNANAATAGWKLTAEEIAEVDRIVPIS